MCELLHKVTCTRYVVWFYLRWIQPTRNCCKTPKYNDYLIIFFALYIAQKIPRIWKKSLMENFIFLCSDSPILVKKNRNSYQRWSIKVNVLKNFEKFTGKQKEISTQLFSCKFCKIFKNTSGRLLLKKESFNRKTTINQSWKLFKVGFWQKGNMWHSAHTKSLN